jgi:3-dehydroquinate synthase
VRALWLVVGVAVAVIATKLGAENLLGLNLDALATGWIASAGAGSAMTIATLLTVDIFLPVPSSLVMALSGAAFGVIWGSGISLVGSIAGEWLGFELARAYGQRWARRVAGEEDMVRMQAVMARHGVVAVMVTRALPVIMETMSVVAGLSSMSRWRFLSASVVGTLPVVVVYAYAGAVSRQMDSVIPAVVILTAVAGAAWVWYRAKVTSG